MMFEWIDKISVKQASLVGTLIGSSIRLIALLLAALFNACLNRRRDDRLRREEAKSIAAALYAELSVLRSSLLQNAEIAEKCSGNKFSVPDISSLVQIWPRHIKNIALLDVVTVQSVIETYGSLPNYTEKLIFDGGGQPELINGRHYVIIKQNYACSYVKLNKSLVSKIKITLDILEKYIMKSKLI